MLGDAAIALGAETVGEPDVGQHAPQPLGEGTRIARRNQMDRLELAPEFPVPGEIARHDRSARRHGLEQHEPARLAEAGRCAHHRGDAEASDLLCLAQPTEPPDSRIASVAITKVLGVGAAPGDPHGEVGRKEGERVEEHVETLARLVTSEEEHRVLVRLGSRVAPEAVGSYTVEQQLERSAEMLLGERQGGLRDGDTCVDAAGDAPQHGAGPAIGRALTGGMEGADHGHRPSHEHGKGDARREGLVEVQHIERAVAERAQSPDRG